MRLGNQPWRKQGGNVEGIGAVGRARMSTSLLSLTFLNWVIIFIQIAFMEDRLTFKDTLLLWDIKPHFLIR